MMLGFIIVLILLLVSMPTSGKQKQKVKIEHYLKNKYTDLMVIKKVNYDFWHNRYWATAYSQKYPNIIFQINQKTGDSGYTDTYQQDYWLTQGEKDFQPIIERLYPKNSRYNIDLHDVAAEFQGEVADYITAQVPLLVSISVNTTFEEGIERQELEKLYQLIDYIRTKKINVTYVFVSYLEKQGGNAKYFKISHEAIEEVKQPNDLSQWLYTSK